MPENDPKNPAGSGKSEQIEIPASARAAIDEVTKNEIWRHKIARYEVKQYEPFVGHSEDHGWCGKKVLVASPTIRHDGKIFDGGVFHVENWYDRKAGRSWGDERISGPALSYTGRITAIDARNIDLVGRDYTPWPEDDEIVYGHWDMPGFPQDRIGEILHVLEIQNSPRKIINPLRPEAVEQALKKLSIREF